ncbi:MAG TPA: ABC transporter substrate-binding protein [Arsenicitalea sp.]|jgi:glucose/mannose transport system substrate-binding protein|nr:ABC transporter substrate-binding protein [Arsenicitalea sp.]
MHLKRLAALTAALMVTATVTASYATDLVIYHTWSTPSEIAALNVLKTQLNADGNGWTDIAIPHDTGANVSLTNMVTGGNPPNVFMNSDPNIIRDLTKQGLTVPMTKFFNDNGVTPHFPEAVLRAITVDGELMKIPTGIHIDGMVYYNLDVAKKAGVDPTKWTSLDAMFADFPKIKAAGFQPLAVGSQDFQVGYLTHALIAAIGGPDIFNRVYGEKPDPTVFDTPEFHKAIDTVREFANNVDQGSSNRAWNETTSMVITGKALMQIHGDWMKGEWRGAGKVAGKDFGCINIPGTKALSVTVDAWGLLGGPSVDDAHMKAELDFAKIVVDPKITGEFAAKKGSTPVRLDAPAADLDQCNTVVLDSLKKPNFSVQNPFNISDSDWVRSVWDIMFKFWGDPKMTTDDVAKQMKDQYQTIFG